MVENDPTVEPSLSSGSTNSGKGSRSAYAGVYRQLTEKELSTPAIAMTLIEHVNRLEAEKSELADFREKYHKLDKEYAVLQSKEGGNRGNDLVFGVALSAGFAAVGYAPSVWVDKGAGAVLLGIGIIVIIVGIIARAVRK